MISGVLCYSFAISSLTSMITKEDITQTKKLEALEALHRIDIDCELDTILYLDVKKAIAKKFRQTNYYKNNDSLLNILPRKLKKGINSGLLSEIVNKQIPLFSGQSSTFKTYISNFLKPRSYKADEYIYKEGSTCDAIYFLLKGKVEYVLPQYQDSPYSVITEGLHFGDLDLIFNILDHEDALSRINQERRIFTVKAKEDCQILVLNKADFSKLHHKFEIESKVLVAGAEYRLSLIIEKKATMEDAFKRRYRKSVRLFRKLRENQSPGFQTMKATTIHLKQDFIEELGSEEELSIIDTSKLNKDSNNDLKSIGIEDEPGGNRNITENAIDIPGKFVEYDKINIRENSIRTGVIEKPMEENQFGVKENEECLPNTQRHINIIDNN